MEHVKNGEIVLNVSPDAAHRLTIGDDMVQFAARFAGVSRECSIPITAVQGIFAKENSQGLFFQAEPAPEVPGEATPTPPTSGGKPRLQIVK
jgi:stringent starvation protein B